MRDFRDAKSMAQTLRDTLQAKSVPISHSESLELVSRMLGLSDWNTLSSLLKTKPRQASPATGAAIYPAIPVRDFVPFPASEFPLYIGRDKTRQALERAFERHREVVVAVQNDPMVDEPDFVNIHEIGVLATVLDTRLLPKGHRFQGRVYDDTIKVLLHAHRRVLIRGFTSENGAYHAEVLEVSEGRIPEVPELVRAAAERFEGYAALVQTNTDLKHPLEPARTSIGKTRDPGRIADIIAAHLRLPLGDKQMLLDTLDPVARLEKVVAVLESPPKAPIEHSARR